MNEPVVFVPTGAEVIAFCGWPTDESLSAQADIHAKWAAMATYAYVRGIGFQGTTMCQPDLAQVVMSAAARSLSNPTLAKRVEAGNFNEVPGSFHGFSLAELAVLNGYRKRAA